jgi:cytochrome o ubiquinol oxidase subunit IV
MEPYNMSAIDHHVEPEYGTGKKTLKIYIIGLLLCVVLTLIPFAAVYVHVTPGANHLWFAKFLPGHQHWTNTFIYVLITISALLQFFVQVLCFLRLSRETHQGRVNIMAFVFTIMVVFILIGGTMWIMFTLKDRMMGAMNSRMNHPALHHKIVK